MRARPSKGIYFAQAGQSRGPRGRVEGPPVLRTSPHTMDNDSMNIFR